MTNNENIRTLADCLLTAIAVFGSTNNAVEFCEEVRRCANDLHTCCKETTCTETSQNCAA